MALMGTSLLSGGFKAALPAAALAVSLFAAAPALADITLLVAAGGGGGADDLHDSGGEGLSSEAGGSGSSPTGGAGGIAGLGGGGGTNILLRRWRWRRRRGVAWRGRERPLGP
jgi:hypothetical protein